MQRTTRAIGIAAVAAAALQPATTIAADAALAKTVNDAKIARSMEKAGGDPETLAPAEFVKFMNEDRERLGKAIKFAKLKAD